MSSWSEVDLSGISLEMELLPEGKYVFSLLPGAKYNQWNPNKIEVGAKVEEGDFKGRVIYFSYGDPDKTPSMKTAMKRLEVALAASTGVEANGTDPLSYLNNADVVGGKFLAPVRHRIIPATEEKPETPKAEISIFKVASVA